MTIPHLTNSPKRLLFACYHFYLDPSNGAAITAREMLSALAGRGWEVTTFCGCGLDFQHATNPLQLLADRNIPIVHQVENSGAVPFSLAFFYDGLLKSSVFLPEENLHVPSQDAGIAFLDLLREHILSCHQRNNQVEPDILVTKIMLVPSLFLESFGRVAAEAMINGIPVIASNRGALPEVLSDAAISPWKPVAIRGKKTKCLLFRESVLVARNEMR